MGELLEPDTAQTDHKPAATKEVHSRNVKVVKAWAMAVQSPSLTGPRCAAWP